MSVSENIRKRRIALHLSQQKIATLLGYKTRSSIAKIESGENTLPYEKLLSLANILNTTIDYLLTGNDNSNQSMLFENAAFNNTQTLNFSGKKANQKVVAIILAGGQYRTDKHNTPYQFITVQGKPIIIYTMEVYQEHPAIDDIYVVCPEGWDGLVNAYAKEFNINKLKAILPAGKTGLKSIRNSIDWISGKYCIDDIIILQESTRPMISSDLISKSIQCCILNNSSITYTSLNNTTPFQINKETGSIKPIDAYSLINIQSPETYTLDFLQKAFIEADKINHELKEAVCANFMYNLGKKLTFCEGSNSNIRIIDEENLILFESIVTKITR